MQDGTAVGRFLIATWNGGGATQPALGLGRLLRTRGHDVRVLAPSSHRERVEALDCTWLALPAAAEFDPAAGRSLEDANQLPYLVRTLCGRAIPDALMAEVERKPADVFVIDYMLRSTLCAAEHIGAPTAALVHTPFAFHGVVDDDDPHFGWDVDPVNKVRSRLGLESLRPQGEHLTVVLQRRCARSLVVMPAEFDPRAKTWAGLRHVGPIFEEPPGTYLWDPPWDAGDDKPLVVVSLSSQYMHQEDMLARIASALDGLDVRALVLTGYELEPDELLVSPSVVVHRYIPHAAVLPHAALLVTHAGMGTVMAAFAAGTPMLCMPLGRDQHDNAARVVEFGAGVTVAADASVSAVQDAARDALTSPVLQAGARRMAGVIDRYQAGSMAVAELESLLARDG